MIFRKYNNEISKLKQQCLASKTKVIRYFHLKIVKNLGVKDHISPLFAQYNNIKKKMQKWLQYKCRDMIVIQMFKSYAEVETKLLLRSKPNKNRLAANI